MRLETKKLLYDIKQAAESVSSFVSGKSYADYESDALLRSGVERQFEIMGEAINRLSKIDPDVTNQITDYQKIISFRNILIHGYADIDNRLVWNIIEKKLPHLLKEVSDLSAEPE
jgi:uncharacterized protein with HEPN domain